MCGMSPGFLILVKVLEEFHSSATMSGDPPLKGLSSGGHVFSAEKAYSFK